MLWLCVLFHHHLVLFTVAYRYWEMYVSCDCAPYGTAVATGCFSRSPLSLLSHETDVTYPLYTSVDGREWACPTHGGVVFADAASSQSFSRFEFRK